MPANHHRFPRSSVDGGFSWWWRRRKFSKREWTIVAAAAAFSILLVILSPVSVSRAFTNTSANSGTASVWVPFTPSSKAQKNSAFCLDGSLPGYHIRRGFGSGSDSWLLHVEGGGWCSTLSSCSARRRTKLGSSTYMEHEVEFLGILSHDPLQNPDFFNWNKVKIRYCDGSSFSSHPDNEFGNGTKIFFRGQIIWDTVMDELLSIGMSKAREALLTGCSAGGLATLIHCDDFRSLLPKDTNVKCLADAGFFLNEKDIAGNRTIDFFYHDVVHLQGVAKSLDHDCITRSEPHKTVAESVGDWYFKRAAAKQIDCPYPCNPTCYNMDLNRG
ncbi:Pectin acetylesterase 5 [Sesamum angolense]|uniref:Pectin acetylesterase n=1 Tax=Sesamum angolense TaxID=2727404 RepID=A0AAE2BNS8_9LAMI|nr:Pectin acetylesterase 5 [Sesamum angolense]